MKDERGRDDNLCIGRAHTSRGATRKYVTGRVARGRGRRFKAPVGRRLWCCVSFVCGNVCPGRMITETMRWRWEAGMLYVAVVRASERVGLLEQYSHVRCAMEGG